MLSSGFVTGFFDTMSDKPTEMETYDVHVLYYLPLIGRDSSVTFQYAYNNVRNVAEVTRKYVNVFAKLFKMLIKTEQTQTITSGKRDTSPKIYLKKTL